MFTGIVQGMGEIAAAEGGEDFRTLTVCLPDGLADGLIPGASVAHNGCCLTVTQTDGDTARFDVMGETLARTNLGRLKTGDKVNIERAARFGDEIGGHVMSGHIMTTAEILRVEQNGRNRTVWFALPECAAPYVFAKGFVGLDGCSLTVGETADGAFNVHLIPETLERTLFGTRQAGDCVNLEIDAHTQAVVDTVARVMAERSRKSDAV
ncbi:MAG: riboflavin synthase subunit alpha [Neisseria sp.]|nr:riboflavin synthase subunit alpha [Neisseria sp.]